MMFKNKYLKQLQDVQTRIKDCKASLTNLNPPTPDSFNLGYDLYCWLGALLHGCKPNIDELFQMEFTEYEDAQCDYLHKLGEYFMNISDYYKSKKEYEIEFARLLKEEHLLKEKLGID